MKGGSELRLGVLLAICVAGIVSALALDADAPPGDTARPRLNAVATGDNTSAPALQNDKADLRLPLEKIKRRTAVQPAGDLFAVSTLQRPPPAPLPAPVTITPPAAPAPPSAPPLPYTYMGKFTDATGKLIIFLAKGDSGTTVSLGELIDGTYRVQSMDDKQLTLTYVPLGINQTLAIGDRP